MPHDLFVQVGLSVGLRRAAAAYVFGRLVDAYAGFRVVVRLRDGRLWAVVRMPLWTLVMLGTWHLATWWGARRIIRRALRDIAVPMRYHVRVEAKKPKVKTNGKARIN